MLVRILRNLGRDFPRHNENDVVEVADDMAAVLLDRGLAVKMPMAEIKAIPNDSVEQATKDLRAYRRKARNEADE